MFFKTTLVAVFAQVETWESAFGENDYMVTVRKVYTVADGTLKTLYVFGFKDNIKNTFRLSRNQLSQRSGLAKLVTVVLK